MRKIVFTLQILFLFTAIPLSLQATHIVGGEMTYKCLGNDEYEIKLTIFRDCFYGVPPFDNPASIGIFSNETGLAVPGVPHLLVELDLMLDDTLDPTLSGDCLVIPPDVCVHTTTYTTTVTLPFLAGGYHLVYQRCCRNNTIANLILPEDVGATYSIEVSEEALLECNSSPVFNDWPPLFLCAGLPYEIDQSAVDDDGDSLVYKLCNPLTGGTPGFPQPIPPNNPPYDTVPFLPPFSVDNFTNIPAVDVMTIDPATGLLTGTPNLIGQFVIGICVEEYRDGELIGVNRRDYQVNIGDCEIVTSTFFVPDVICGTTEVSFTNESLNSTNFEWYFNDPANPGATSTAFEPTYTYDDFGSYEVMLIAEPGDICVDTFIGTVNLVPNTVLADFDLQVIQCADNLLVTATDLSVDSLSTIDSWEWTLLAGPTTLTSTDQNPTFTVDEVGTATLSLTVTSANGCADTYEEDFLLKSDPPVLDLGPDQQFCGAQMLTLDAGVGFVSYMWNTLEETQSISVNQEGTYSVTATDACGQEQFDEVEISIDTVDIDLPETVEVCLGDSYTFDVPGFVSYEWAPSDYLSCTDCPDPTTTPLTNITYTLTAISSDSCVGFDSVQVIVLPTAETFETFDLCNGDTIEIFGEMVSDAGDYSATFTGSNGCDSTHTVTVNILPTTTVVIDIFLCEGDTAVVFGEPVTMEGVFEMTFVAANGCDSTVIVAVGVAPNVFTSEEIEICFGETVDIFGVPTGTSGVYEMIFEGSNGCDSTHTITLTVFDEITIQTTIEDASCFGFSDGSATANASGGTGGFTYEWGLGTPGQTLTGVPAGTYSVTATDSFGCTAEATVTVGEPTAVEVNATGVDVSCDELGSVSASANGGTGGYTYLWNTGDMTADVTGLMAGIYSVTATDDNGCEGSASVEITGALGPDATVTVDQQLTEDMPNSGVLSVSIDGGTAPFDIEWSNGETTAAIDSLGSGEYTATVTDANGCTATDEAYLFVPACTGGKIWNDTNRNGCQMGGELGIADVELELNGTDIWGNSVTATTTTAINGEYIFEDLPPGDYQVTLLVPSGYELSPADACVDDFVDSDFDENGVSYTVELTEGHCCLIVDGGLYDACLQVIDPGSICCDQVLCGPGNDPGPITSTSPATGAGGPIEYMWMYSTTGGPTGDGSWTGIPGTNSTSYDPGPLSQTTYFARCVRAVGCADWLEGNVVEIFVDDVAVAEISGPSSSCVGEEVSYSATDNGSGASYLWHFGPWASPSSANTQNVDVTWNQQGVVYITLTVEKDGCTSTTSYGIAISNDPNYCSAALGNPNIGNLPGYSSTSSMLNQFSLFPNPADDYLTVRWEEALAGDVNIELLSLDGRQLMTARASGEEQSFQADLTKFSAGMYLLRVRFDEGEQEVFRVVKK